MERTQLVTIQKDLSDAPAILVTMETDTTAQVSQCFIPFSRQRSYEVSRSSDYGRGAMPRFTAVISHKH